jgi:RHS repeat-associated protein
VLGEFAAEPWNSNPQDAWSFATYWTDSASGLDYANNRYYSNAYGRFMTPDPYQQTAISPSDPKNPQSWNRYAYVIGDPINSNDPSGQDLGSTLGDNTFASGTPPSLTWGGPCDSAIMTYVNGMQMPSPCDFVAVSSLPLAAAESQASAMVSCELTETAYVYSYLSKYNSPLAQYAGFIVADSDLFGIDDRFIVALAGVESIYGKTQQTSPTWGFYNAFSNAAHCQALSATSDCYKVNPYSNYGAAISDVINLITGGKYFGSGLNTVQSIYDLYNRVPSANQLVTIYQQLNPTT